MAKRTAMLQQAETMLVNDAPILPIYYYTNRYVYRDNVKGLYLNPRSQIMFKSIYVAH